MGENRLDMRPSWGATDPCPLRGLPNLDLQFLPPQLSRTTEPLEAIDDLKPALNPATQKRRQLPVLAERALHLPPAVLIEKAQTREPLRNFAERHRTDPRLHAPRVGPSPPS